MFINPIPSLLEPADIFHNVESNILYGPSRPVGVAAAGDPIADAVGLLRPRSFHHAGLRGTGPWALRFESFPHVQIGGVAIGQCWLTLDGHDPLLLRQGDFYLLGGPPPYVLASELGAEPRPATSLDPLGTQEEVSVTDDGGEETYICRTHFAFDDADASFVVDALPRLVHVPATDPQGESLGHLSQLLVSEFATTAPGGSLILDHLAQILLVHMLRAHANRTKRPTGWLGALTDDRIGIALRAMHADVSRRWTLAELAELASMSRSAFAASFKQRVGRPPLEYLIEWRMSLARDALLHGSSSLSELASVTGYESESAFSTAFRRVVGSSPRQFREQGRRAARPPGARAPEEAERLTTAQS